MEKCSIPPSIQETLNCKNMAKLKKRYVRIQFDDHCGNKHTWFAVKMNINIYRKVSSDGQWGYNCCDEYFIGAPRLEKICVMSKNYGRLVLQDTVD